MSDLPRHIYCKKGVYYFQRRGWPTVRMKCSPGTQAFERERMAILTADLPEPVRDTLNDPKEPCYFKSIEVGAKKRAAQNGREYDLPSGWAKAQYAKQDGCCALTGVRFTKMRRKHAPHAPSIDRRDSALGYTPDNCRLVTYIANCAKNQFAEDQFYEMCLAATRHKAKVEKIAGQTGNVR